MRGHVRPSPGWRGDHPHVRGEHNGGLWSRIHRTIPTCGSTYDDGVESWGPSPRAWGHGKTRDPTSSGPSPRAWGAPALAFRVPFSDGPSPRVGSTADLPGRAPDHPTCVGSTTGRGDRWTIPRAWARRWCVASFIRGPSPCVGARTSAGRSGADSPCVGSTEHQSDAQDGGPSPRAWERLGGAPPDHGPSPRAWGARAHRAVLAGPSPRAWGHGATQSLRDRTIPTCVGSTPPRSGDQGTIPLRGEHKSRPPGGPPHVRGEHGDGDAQRTARDHPHVRGEHIRYYPHGQPPTDHPHVRGSTRLRSSPISGQRTIPTCVGAPQCAGAPVWRTDHPHVRGEHARAGRFCIEDTGPSPRAWGARPRSRAAAHRRRTIPTCVGSTEDDLQF